MHGVIWDVHMLANADLHIHSPFSMAVSRAMHPEKLLNACALKGLHVLGTGDALHPAWQEEWKPFLSNSQGICVIPTGEIEDDHRVHHLILAEDFGQFDQLRDLLSQNSRSIGTNGRPHVFLSGEAIAQRVHEVGALIGPAHAFTPWTALFAYHDSVAGCYGKESINFMELGLSADSSYGAGIPDLSDVPFLTNSDAHSPLPEKIGREFNKIQVSGNLTPRNLLNCISAGTITMNAGFFPEEGKYNRTACVRCFTQYSVEDAGRYNWRCPADNGLIKKGVYDRARELSHGTPRQRPPYLHLIPLGQIIQTIEGVSSPQTKKCREIYNEFITTFGNEIDILISTPLSEIRMVHNGVADAIAALRENHVILHPGGGGKYGTFSLL
ncbi:endonuclease Q family protein [Methanoregula sp.]|uniref:endonuclease Q family protein n=2 Tax=Methanoregula sp. TaxID=2052170 RepID=UPI003BB01A5C